MFHLNGTFDEKKANYKLAFAHSLSNQKWQFKDNKIRVEHVYMYMIDLENI